MYSFGREQLREVVRDMVIECDEFNFTESQMFKHVDSVIEAWNEVGTDAPLEDLVQEMTIDYRENHYLGNVE
jgi:hypothetical protein